MLVRHLMDCYKMVNGLIEFFYVSQKKCLPVSHRVRRARLNNVQGQM